MAEAIHTMRAVSKRTGLSPHVIRVWERRYGVVQPIRTPTNRRVYRDEDVKRLELLHRATEAGHAISQVCKLSNQELERLLKDVVAALPTPGTGPTVIDHRWGSEMTASALAAVRAMDVKVLESTLESAIVELGTQGLLTQVAAPLAQQVGELWQDGVLNSAHEHFLSAVLRTFLSRHAQQYVIPPSAPIVVVTTPVGQIHELGAVLVSAAAASFGWRVIYLGTSLPAAEIAGTAQHRGARAVALSIVYPPDDQELPRELKLLREYLPDETEIIVGGRGVTGYAATLVEIGARVTKQLEDLNVELEAIRKTGLQRGLKGGS